MLPGGVDHWSSALGSRAVFFENSKIETEMRRHRVVRLIIVSRHDKMTRKYNNEFCIISLVLEVLQTPRLPLTEVSSWAPEQSRVASGLGDFKCLRALVFYLNRQG